MTERDALRQEIIALVARFVEGKSTPESRLYGDLGMTGDDAAEFIEAFATQYAVDMTDFHWLRYFDDEGMDMFTPGLALVTRLLSPAFSRRWRAALEAEREITIDHLVDVAETHRWRHPGPEYPRRGPLFRLDEALSSLALCVVAFLFTAGGLALFGYFTGRIGEVSIATMFGLVATVALPILLIWASWRNVQRKLASAQ